MKNCVRFNNFLMVVAVLAVSQSSMAGVNDIEGSVSVDNSFTAYVSTDDTVQGTQIGTGNDWGFTSNVSGAITPGVTNYLHIFAQDEGGPQMFIGEFHLNIPGMVFANGTQSLLTNTTHWAVSSTGFGLGAVLPADLGPDGMDPWGNRPNIDDSARFIWHPGDESANPVYFTAVIQPGEVSTATRATFEVNKIFSGSNPGEVTVAIDCNTGQILDQSKNISEGEGVEFVVTEFDSGELNCEIIEDVSAGYDPEYDNGSEITSVSCNYEQVVDGDAFSCTITNSPIPVEVEIIKDWVVEGNANAFNDEFDLTLFCDSEIIDGYQLYQTMAESPEGGNIVPSCGLIVPFEESSNQNGSPWCKRFFGEDEEVFIAEVVPNYPSSSCYVTERVFDSAIEVDNGCQNIVVSVNQGASCVITNTVFFEGIPTLSQYGKIVMALLLLGMAVVGLRRMI